MRFFTAKLYEQVNSPGIALANAADAQWADAERKYEAALKTIRPALSSPVKELADKLCLHDAKLLAIVKDKDSVVHIWLRQNHQLHTLTYQIGRASCRERVYSSV